MRRRHGTWLTTASVTLALLAGGCGSGSTSSADAGTDTTPSATPSASPGSTAVPDDALVLVARDDRFDLAELTVPGGGQVVIALDNEDDRIVHDLAVYERDEHEQPDYGAPVFESAQVPGGSLQVLRFDAPPAGTYVFVCTYHRLAMRGTLEVR